MSLITMPPMMPVPELASATAEELERLRELQAPERVFLSCYVHLGVQDRIRARYRIAVRDAVRRLAQ
ncbi:MAG: hypothetical protein OEW17_00180, partial [Gemmatimonadota bacterium]|nr:hypothetical protein [Gemmatimonadota bacterium]